MTDVFNGDQPATSVTDQLVGEGKKFKTVEDLAKGKQESDAFIARLTAEQEQLRADLERRVNVEKELEALRAELVEAQKKAQAPKAGTQSELTPDRIQKIVTETITATERQRTVNQNVDAANQAVLAKFEGNLEKAAAFVKEKAAELSMSVDDLKGIAARSPTAFQKIVLGEATVEASRTDTVTKSTVDPAKLAAVSPPVKEGSKEYFDKLRVTDPKKYWKPSTQQAIFDAVKAGTYQL